MPLDLAQVDTKLPLLSSHKLLTNMTDFKNKIYSLDINVIAGGYIVKTAVSQLS